MQLHPADLAAGGALDLDLRRQGGKIEARGRLAAAIAFPDPEIGLLQVIGEARGLEQRHGLAIGLQPLADRRQLLGMAARWIARAT
jgi:hypothetical protein